jgi:hypothetical protein
MCGPAVIHRSMVLSARTLRRGRRALAYRGLSRHRFNGFADVPQEPSDAVRHRREPAHTSGR